MTESMHRIEPTFPSWTRLAAASLIVLALSGAFFFSFHDYGLAPFDEGVLLEGIRLAAQGRMDASRFLHYSIQYDAFAALSPDGDPNIEALRRVWVVVRALTAWLILLVGMRLLPLRWALIPVLLFLALPGPWHKALVAFCVCLCLHAMLHAVETGLRVVVAPHLAEKVCCALDVVAGCLRSVGLDTLDVGERSAERFCDRHPAGLKTDDDHLRQSFVPFDDLVSHSADGSTDRIGVEHLVPGNKNAPIRGRTTALAFSQTTSSWSV